MPRLLCLHIMEGHWSILGTSWDSGLNEVLHRLVLHTKESETGRTKGLYWALRPALRV